MGVPSGHFNGHLSAWKNPLKLGEAIDDHRGMRKDKIAAAKRLCDSLVTEEDFAMYLLGGHPNEKVAEERISQAVFGQIGRAHV